MKSAVLGSDISAVEVTNVSKHGFWLLIKDQELFLPFETFPWFKDVPIGKILNVVQATEQHLYWPDLDVDLDVETILHPERFPLVGAVKETRESYTARNNDGTVDVNRIDDCVLALLQLTLHDDSRAWKGYDFEVMDRLYEKGLIFDPKGKAKSVVLTEEGLARSERLFAELFKK